MSVEKSYKDVRIVFMGTPEFAVASLDALVKAGCNIVAVITAPDKPAGRGMELQQSAVKKYAVSNHLPVLQPDKLRNPQFLDDLKSLNADLQICVAFRMLPEIVWNMPPMGTINLHGSLLPQYRGAAPINWAVINGEKETGVTTFKLKHQIDTGDILLQERFAIEPQDNAGTVHDKMKEIGAAVLVDTVKQMAEGELKESPQLLSSNETLHHAPKIFTETCEIDFCKPVETAHNLVRGLSPYPTAFTFLNGKKLKIFQSAIIEETPTIAPGELVTDGKTYLKYACNNGYLSVIEIQLEGKKKMIIGDFLRGYRFQ
ncbi:MAG: methionyl-tRNA formyltransferase [Sphingobacteriales bacterium 41-5]|mgnify:CR=1 FL=1|nr:MAG: methionyl-tRNA formyltransferase [Sphingobacteriales bacterium 41-5]